VLVGSPINIAETVRECSCTTHQTCVGTVVKVVYQARSESEALRFTRDYLAATEARRRELNELLTLVKKTEAALRKAAPWPEVYASADEVIDAADELENVAGVLAHCARAAGDTPPTGGRTKERHLEEIAARFAHLGKLSHGQIGQQLGISAKAVQHKLRRAGVPPKPPGRPKRSKSP
jgi:hypothetical protein